MIKSIVFDKANARQLFVIDVESLSQKLSFALTDVNVADGIHRLCLLKVEQVFKDLLVSFLPVRLVMIVLDIRCKHQEPGLRVRLVSHGVNFSVVDLTRDVADAILFQ